VRAVVAGAKKYGAATVYWDNGYTGQYGFGLIDRRSLAVTQQGMINAIMSGLGSSPSLPGRQIVGAQSGRCVDVPNGSTTNGTQVQLWDCNGQSSQSWTYTSGKQLTSGGKCLDASGRGTTNGTTAVVWDCNGQSNQQWNVNSNGTITGVHSNLCLDASGRGTVNGTKLLLWSCSGQANQQWALR
jgi:hypothetical protein